MNRNVLSIALTLVVAIVGFGSIACQPAGDTNSSLTTNRNATPPAETVNAASVEAEIKKLSKEWADSYKTKDAAAVRRIVADDAILTAPDGTTGTKNDEVQYAETGAFTAESWDMVDEKVNVLNANAAVLTGRTVIKKGKLKDPKSGQTIDITGEYRYLDVYAKRNGTWQVVASQVTKIAAPPPPPKADQK